MNRKVIPYAARWILAGVLFFVMTLTAGCDREPAAWSAAESRNTVESYQAYLNRYPDGLHAADAKQMMDEARDWLDAKVSNHIESLESFLDRYPGTQRKPEAEALLAPLREQRDWTKATGDNTAAAIDSFLSKYPQSVHVDEAKRLLVPLYEAEAWDDASRQPSVESMEKFIGQYPLSSRLADAQGVLRALRWAKAKAANGHVTTQGMFMGGYQKFVSVLQVTHDLSCDMGTAQIQYTIDAGSKFLEMASDGTRLARNGADARATGSIVVAGSDGSSTTMHIVGIIWAQDDNLFGSYVYSHDTHLGVVNAKRFEGLRALPPIESGRALCVFRIGEDGTLAVQP